MDAKELKKTLASLSLAGLIATGSVAVVSAGTGTSCSGKKSEQESTQSGKTPCSGGEKGEAKTSCSGGEKGKTKTSCSGGDKGETKTSCSGGSSCSGGKTSCS